MILDESWTSYIDGSWKQKWSTLLRNSSQNWQTCGWPSCHAFWHIQFAFLMVLRFMSSEWRSVGDVWDDDPHNRQAAVMLVISPKSRIANLHITGSWWMYACQHRGSGDVDTKFTYWIPYQGHGMPHLGQVKRWTCAGPGHFFVNQTYPSNILKPWDRREARRTVLFILGALSVPPNWRRPNSKHVGRTHRILKWWKRKKDSLRFHRSRATQSGLDWSI